MSIEKGNGALSFARRVTLSKSVIEAVPIYPMMSCAVPKTCLQEIQKIQRAFIWGDNEIERHVHAVNWIVVTKPKLRGGFGIRRLEKMNEACLLKLGWKLRSGDNNLWSMVLKGKYETGAI